MTVHIAPASEEDSKIIATALEGGICPWPGYQMIALSGKPWVYVLPHDAADALLRALYVASETVGVQVTDGDGQAMVFTRPDEPSAPAEPAPEEPAPVPVQVYISDEQIQALQPVLSPPPDAVSPPARPEPEPEPARDTTATVTVKPSRRRRAASREPTPDAR